MPVICCLPLSRRQVRTTDEDSTKTCVVSPPAYDLIANEGADYQQRLWSLVLDEKKRSLTQARNLVKTRDTVTDITTPETYLQSLTAAYNESGFAQRMPRIREIFANIEPFTQAITTMVHSEMICALLWGSLMLVFQVSRCSCPCQTNMTEPNQVCFASCELLGEHKADVFGPRQAIAAPSRICPYITHATATRVLKTSVWSAC
jgi:hypothetical protein